jgi:hypothetical protein
LNSASVMRHLEHLPRVGQQANAETCPCWA